MRVDIFINPFAGKSKVDSLRAGVSQALFRCDLHFHESQNKESFAEDLKAAIQAGSEALVLCGGDGTLNEALQTLMPYALSQKLQSLPPIGVVSTGTANDFASELRIGKSIDKAARHIIEGDTREVDVLRVRSGEQEKFLLTNGGIGVPADTADSANVLKSWAKKQAFSKKPGLFNHLAQLSVQKIGPMIYELLFGLKLYQWSPQDWEVEIQTQQQTVRTKSSIVLINNQSRLGSGFTTAPFTKNNDGYFNILSLRKDSKLQDLRAVLNVRRGAFPEDHSFSTFETRSARLRAVGKRKLTFFGDGEILFRDVDEVRIDCISPGISVFHANPNSSRH